MKLQEILRNIRKADQDYRMIQDGDRIAVGVSGGKDSMVLLAALHMYSKFQGKNFHVVGIHIKIGFPNMDFSEVEAFCERESIEFHSFDSMIYKILQRNLDKNGDLKCSLCSKFKKASVIEEAKKLNCNKIAFGHHSNDAVETLFMNMIHGGKIATFLPKMYMSRTDVMFIRPLIYCFEEDILNAQCNNEIPFVKSTCPNDGYTERQEMKDMLKELYEKYPMAKGNFVHMLSNEKQVDLWHKLQDDEEDPFEKMMKEKNIKLQENLNRIDAIEKILMGLQIEDDITLTVRSLQAAFTSEMGLGYSRAMYFRYSREIDTLVGECSHVNSVVKNDMMKAEKEESDGFEFQISTLTKLVALMKIPFKDDNLLGKALKEKRIIYHNDKGYKYNLGNDLFKSLGINNFLIFPVYSESRNYGCILVDYFGKDNLISQEEAELMTLLCINTSIRIGNKMLEEEKIDYERTATIGKLADRFFGRREDSLKKIISVVERMTECDYNNSCLKDGINSIRDEVIKIKHENAILKEYSKSYVNNMEIIEFEKIHV